MKSSAECAQQRLDHGIGGGVLDAGIVERALVSAALLLQRLICSLPGDSEALQVHWIMSKSKVLSRAQYCAVSTWRMRSPMPSRSSVRRIAQHQPLLLARLGQELEGERHAAFDEAAALELAAGLGEQLVGGLQVGAVVAAAVGDGQA